MAGDFGRVWVFGFVGRQSAGVSLGFGVGLVVSAARAGLERRGRTIFAGLGRFLSAAQRGRYIFPQLVSFFTGFPIPLAAD